MNINTSSQAFFILTPIITSSYTELSKILRLLQFGSWYIRKLLSFINGAYKCTCPPQLIKDLRYDFC